MQEVLTRLPTATNLINRHIGHTTRATVLIDQHNGHSTRAIVLIVMDIKHIQLALSTAELMIVVAAKHVIRTIPMLQ